MSITALDLNKAAALFAQRGDNTSVICSDLAAKLTRYGSFASDRQKAFAQRLIDQANGVAPKPTATLATFGSVKRALDAAHSRGLKRPALRIQSAGVDYVVTYKFSRAPDHGKNPGAIYVTRGELYIGKIAQDGAFNGSRDCATGDVATLTAIAADPLGAARASGKLTGQCSCCGRPLSDPESQQRGIGPICEQKYFAV